jgi:hypothetical protein
MSTKAVWTAMHLTNRGANGSAFLCTFTKSVRAKIVMAAPFRRVDAQSKSSSIAQHILPSDGYLGYVKGVGVFRIVLGIAMLV